MRRGIGAAVLGLWVGVASGHTLAFFGVRLSHATRATVNAALTRAGFRIPSRGPEEWFDTYRINGQPAKLQGASRLTVNFTRGGRFAIAQYTFPSFDNPHQVKDIVAMVQYKYGPPTSTSGNPAHGPVVARWQEPGGTEIKVWRGWPSTSTFMDLENVAAVRRFRVQYPAVAKALGTSLPNTAAAGRGQWQPPPPSDLTTPGTNRPIPMKWEIGIIMVFSVPAMIIVMFAHFLARVTRIPRTWKAVVNVTLGRMAQWFRKPAWKRR